MRKLGVGLWVLLIVAACDRDKAPSQPLFDPERVTAELVSKLENMWNHPAVSRASDAFFDAVGGSKDVVARGSALATELGQDPEISQAIAGLMSAVGEDPAVQAAAMALMQQHPDATPDQIGELFGAHIEDVWGRPPVSTAWMASFERVVPRIEHDPALLTIESSLSARIAPHYSDAELARRWNKRIVELAGGSRPTREQGTELLITHMLDDERLDQVGVALLTNPTLRAESSAALAKLLALPAVDRDLHKAAAAMLADPAAHRAALDLFHQLAADRPDPDAVSRALDTILDAPALADAIHDLIRIATSDPDARAIFAAWLDHITADPALQAAFDKLWYGW
jgi:hypothetical protein